MLPGHYTKNHKGTSSAWQIEQRQQQKQRQRLCTYMYGAASCNLLVKHK